MSFYDLFNASVHSNSCLSDAHKLHYLKSSLQGEAARLLKSLQITDSNYQLARNILEERYSNIRVIARSHIHTLCSYPSLRQENSKALRQLLEIFHENTLALEALEIDIHGVHFLYTSCLKNLMMNRVDNGKFPHLDEISRLTLNCMNFLKLAVEPWKRVT